MRYKERVKNYKIILIIISLSVLLTACSKEDNAFKNMVNEINEYNENIQVPDVDLSLFTNELQEEEILTWSEFESFFEEGRGFMPDIIVNDDEALDKVLKLIEHYDLN